MNSAATPNFRFIDTPSQFAETVTLLETKKMLAVDLEADSMYHFKEKVCLIQLADSHTGFLIDPLAISDVSALKLLFTNSGIQKIFHGADYDIRSIYRDFGITVNNLFDTQVASRFLGVNETGLDAVLRKRFAIDLDKKYQKKDWSRRPLSNDMMTYAARDALYLVSLAKGLQRDLRQKGRLAWVEEECKYLSRVRPNSSNNEPLFFNFKGAGRLEPRQLAVLEALLQFRRQVAARKDRPLFKVFGSATLLNIARGQPQTLPELKKVQPLSPRQVDMYGHDLVRIVKDALGVPTENLPRFPHKSTPMPRPVVRKRIQALKLWRDACAVRLELDPALICSKSLMGELARTNPGTLRELSRVTELKNWQKKVFGDEIISVLNRLRKGHGRKSNS